ncbi:MAG: 5'/3'-nucleotidase SurE [Oscillospiraceae bacterium]|nr:5'/3'-nucleotidase SurE [Oscillospiraceae bacterium]
MMRILVTNDDGITSVGLIELARAAKELGEVWVVAPAAQCSAMSQRISVFGEMILKHETDFPVEGVHAYSITGTPADCVKVALMNVMPEAPDVVFSGINNGYNVGIGIMYSGTIGAAKEALVRGIPAIAFSNTMNGAFEIIREKLVPIAKDLLTRPIGKYELWNVNFPGCTLKDYKGILEDRRPEGKSYYTTEFVPTENPDGTITLAVTGDPCLEAGEGSDTLAVVNNYISIGKVRSGVLEDGVFE